MFVDRKTLDRALASLYGTAGHLIKIWLTLKHMGLRPDSGAIIIDTSNSTNSLKRLFSFGDSEGSFYVPFAHTPRYLVMKRDASRSIIQTTIQRWATSGSVVTCDPTDYLSLTSEEGGKIRVSTNRRYPFGLGFGTSGFALNENSRVSIPLTSFSVWYGRQSDIPVESDATEYLITKMLEELNITPSERELVFIDDDLEITTQSTVLSNKEILEACLPFIKDERHPILETHFEEFDHYTRRIKSMTSEIDLPKWMKVSPADEVRELLRHGSKSLLLYGPPRTGKTHLVDSIIPRNSEERCTIQIHDGWSYDHLIEGLKPDSEGNWNWKDGPLKEAILTGKKFIVMEEINRTSITQALGEVFSLLEAKYRGERNGITLRSGSRFWIPEDVIIIMTMNTTDKSTEDIDDALIGRVAAVEFPPRAENLNELLISNSIPDDIREKTLLLFSTILEIYPLGHGYFADLSGSVDALSVIKYYKSRIRPVLYNFLGDLRVLELKRIDNIVDDIFGEK